MSNYIDFQSLSYDDRRLLALESLLKRIAIIGEPFVLKGSLLTRQYLDSPEMRQVEDIDFLYVGEVKNDDHAQDIFTSMLIRATEMDIGDGVVFESFRHNQYWEDIEYIMADDFPTTFTELEYRFKDTEGNFSHYHELKIDVSFNLKMIEPIPLNYHSQFFGDFIVPYTAPIASQVAWKLHQTIIRPRFKDLCDLEQLLTHSSFNEDAVQACFKSIAYECSHEESITLDDIKKVLVGDLSYIFPAIRMDFQFMKAVMENDAEKEMYFQVFIANLRKIMDNAGINEASFAHFPPLN